MTEQEEKEMLAVNELFTFASGVIRKREKNARLETSTGA